MKIGLILECTTDGPDWQVYSLWVRRLLGEDVRVEQSSAGNKKLLIQQAGKRAQALFDEGCEKVLIMWDLWPAWGQAKPNEAEDVAAIDSSLRQAGVVNPCVYMLCVNRMLETLLLVDGNALTQLLGLRGKTPRHQNRPSTIHDPKEYLGRWFKQARRADYVAHTHAKEIAKRVDLARLRRRTREFQKFESSLQQTPCTPPLAWATRASDAGRTAAGS